MELLIVGSLLIVIEWALYQLIDWYTMDQVIETYAAIDTHDARKPNGVEMTAVPKEEELYNPIQVPISDNGMDDIPYPDASLDNTNNQLSLADIERIKNNRILVIYTVCYLLLVLEWLAIALAKSHEWDHVLKSSFFPVSLVYRWATIASRLDRHKWGWFIFFQLHYYTVTVLGLWLIIPDDTWLSFILVLPLGFTWYSWTRLNHVQKWTACLVLGQCIGRTIDILLVGVWCFVLM